MATLWRCFPWDRDAPHGSPFSAAHLVPGQIAGRFDLQDNPPVRYLAESPQHAIGEILAPLRGTVFLPGVLRQKGHPLAVVDVTVAEALMANVIDCTDPDVLGARGVRPDELAHHDRAYTQAIARRLHDPGDVAGLRWWSALTGAWHTVVIFTDRESPGDVTFGSPRHLAPDDDDVIHALDLLGIRMR